MEVVWYVQMHATKDSVESSLKMDMLLVMSLEHERKYATHDLELDAIVHTLNMWRHYLMGKRF
jgi:hypothetical protein